MCGEIPSDVEPTPFAVIKTATFLVHMYARARSAAQWRDVQLGDLAPLPGARAVRSMTTCMTCIRGLSACRAGAMYLS